MMREFLLGLVLTLAVAASLIVVVDRFREGGGPRDIADIEARLARLEEALGVPEEPQKAGPDAGATRTSPERRVPGARDLSDVVSLLEEVEGMILDAEKALRMDLKRIYEKLLQRMDEMAATAGKGPASEGTARLAVREKLQEMGVRLIGEGMIEIRGRFAESTRVLELVAVAPGGRAHEALLIVDVVPSALKIALEDIGMVETDLDVQTGSFPDDAGGVYVYVTWEGLEKPRRVEDLILDLTTDDTMERTPFVFTASYMYTDSRTWERHYSADVNKDVIALTWNYANAAVLACPLEKAANDQIWAPSADTGARPGRDVRVLIRKDAHPVWDEL